MNRLKEELSFNDALSCIQGKDWYRARTVNPNRIDAMISAITDYKKKNGRLLALYFYKKFVNNKSEDALHHFLDNVDVSDDTKSRIHQMSIRELLNNWTYDAHIISDPATFNVFKTIRDEQQERISTNQHHGFTFEEDIEEEDTELIQAKKEFEEFVKKHGLTGKIKVFRDWHNNEIAYSIEYEKTLYGNDLFDYIDSSEIKIETTADYDDEYYSNNTEIILPEDKIADKWVDSLLDNEYLEVKDDLFEFHDYDIDFENNIVVESYYAKSATDSDPAEEDIELDGSFEMSAIFYYRKKDNQQTENLNEENLNETYSEEELRNANINDDTGETSNNKPRFFVSENYNLSESFKNLDVDTIKRVCLKYVKEHGYMPGSYGYHNNNGTSYRQSPTVDEIYKLLNNTDNLDSFKCSGEELEEMNRYASELQPEGQYADYQQKCLDVWSKNELTKDDLKILAAFCNSFIKNNEYLARQQAKREREQAHQAEIESSGNVYAGEVGDEVTFTVAEAKITGYIHPNSYYATPYPMWSIKDTQGRTFTWGDTKNTAQIEPNDTVKGKIKALTEFRGIKQTRLIGIKINHAGQGFTVFEDVDLNEEDLEETYSEEELKDFVGKTYNQQKIQNIYRRNKYNDKRLFAHTKCTKCGREKRVFLSNLINDPEKYGSCVCSDANLDGKYDKVQGYYDGSKKLSNNTSGFTGVSKVKTTTGNKWRAYIDTDGERKYLGDFTTKSKAIDARQQAAEKGIKWYKEHKNQFKSKARRKAKRYKSKRFKK